MTSVDLSLAALSMHCQTRQDDLVECEKTLATHNLELARDELQALLLAQNELLMQAGRVQIGGSVLPALIDEFASSCSLDGGKPAETLTELQEAFYHLRDDAPAHIPDAAILSGLRIAFEGEACGCVEAVESMGIAAVLRLADERESDDCEPENGDDWLEREAEGTYVISDDEGHTYRWSPRGWDGDDWIDDVTADGWLGERWEDD